MPSPFPGMDPYLEEPSLWRDVHQSLITYMRDALQPQIAPRYVARIDERVHIGEPAHDIIPDITISRPRMAPGNGESGGSEESGGGVAVATAPAATAVEVTADEPVVLSIPYDYHESFLVITDPRGGQIITVIEVLSPTNKSPAGEGQMGYSRKLRELYLSGVNIVEMDLLRGGLPTVMVETDPLVTVPPHDYLIAVSRSMRRNAYEMYPFTLRDRLPRIAIPLRPPDADVALDLPALFTRCYDNGAFSTIIDYRTEPNPPLNPEQAAWADALLREKGLRLPEHPAKSPKETGL